jgi:hypothetical protein
MHGHRNYPLRNSLLRKKKSAFDPTRLEGYGSIVVHSPAGIVA